jgi:hypothetical protein
MPSSLRTSSPSILPRPYAATPLRPYAASTRNPLCGGFRKRRSTPTITPVPQPSAAGIEHEQEQAKNQHPIGEIISSWLSWNAFSV